jgi:hypothetical protein
MIAVIALCMGSAFLAGGCFGVVLAGIVSNRLSESDRT